MAAKATSADPDHFSRRMREAMDVEPQLFHRTIGALQVTTASESRQHALHVITTD